MFSLRHYPTYLAVANELDELVEQWPRNRQRTVALLAAREAFFDAGATHWDVETVADEDLTNVHALMRQQREWARRQHPARAARYAHLMTLARAALAESQRRKQGPPTGSLPHRPRRSRPPKALRFTPAAPRPNNRAEARPRYSLGQLLRDPLAYYASLNELDALLERWPYKRNRILHLLAVHEGLAQRGGRVADESQMLDPGNPAHHRERAQHVRRVTARAADAPRAARHAQRLREALAFLRCREKYGK
ncbi:hypothetical protein MON38_20470 [Hymenobacter sp. DH14]|uniref:Uncharacterized protein n=1 Tax=Hymenobacter cyanobacteriorum TaxID=2926463 RepID=A0A9X2AKF7_9BACT|nr:hypothetical protein [Hymenobacter cyanobacteriorum]MCI1189804.1 hypothetical protein [Hymenobacter cyanobacteriorum]